jgi:hypothetical protein
MPQKKPITKFKNSEGAEYTFKWRKPNKKFEADGMCENPTLPKPKIFVDWELKERRKMAVVVEELTHAFFYMEPEYRVRRFSATVTRILYKSGWRKVK